MFASWSIKYKLSECGTEYTKTHATKFQVEGKKSEFQIELKSRALNLMNWGIHQILANRALK